MKKFYWLGLVLFTSLLLTSCAQSQRRGFDPAPYLGEAFQRLTAYEQVAIQPSAARYIYAEEEGSDLAVLFLFVTFTRSDETPDKFAMITVYVNPNDETLVNAFIDRIFYDELNATQTSLQNFQHLYTSQLAQAEAFENHTVTTSDIENSVIQAAMQAVNRP